MAASEVGVVHAVYLGVRVIRRTRKWFLEPATHYYHDYTDYVNTCKVFQSTLQETKQVTLEEAAHAAAEGVKEAWSTTRNRWPAGFKINFGKGSKKFDNIVKSIYPELCIDIQTADLGDGHKFLVMKCYGCGEWMRINESQKAGFTCTYHAICDGGCGFHGYTVGAHAGYLLTLGKRSEEAAKRQAEKEAANQQQDKVKEVL